MTQTVENLDTQKLDGTPKSGLVDKSWVDSVNASYTGTRMKSKDHFDQNENTTDPHTVVVKKSPTRNFTNFKLMTSETPVCHLLYEDIDNGSFYLQWKPNSSDEVKNSVLMMVPSKNVPKFKLTQDGGRAPFSHKVAPDKMKFYSSICQFLKLAKDYNSKFQLMPAWNTNMPYKCDLYLHYEDNKVVKVDTEHLVFENVNCLAVVSISTHLSIKMSKEQVVTAVRNVGYAITF